MTGDIVVLGSRGQLGGELCRQLGRRAVGLSRADLDITHPAEVHRVLTACRPLAVINTAAYTQVDRAEQDRQTCDRVNAEAVGHLAETCARLECTLVQISTDYVFGGPAGSGPRRETDAPSAQGVYARSKLAGERLAAEAPRHFIVRTCGLYGRTARPGSGNPGSSDFVETMLRLGQERSLPMAAASRVRVVGDQHCTPSFVRHVARAILFLLQTEAFGIYHVTSTGATTWHAFASEIFRLAGITAPLERITTAEYGAAAPRPADSVLDTAKYHALGGPPLPAWQDALAEYLGERGEIDRPPAGG